MENIKIGAYQEFINSKIIREITLPTEIIDDDLICVGKQSWSGKEFKEMVRLDKLKPDIKSLPVIFEEVKK